MAQLKTLLVSGATRLAGTVYANLLKANAIEAPTEPGAITYGPGSSGQVLKSDGSNIYWGSVNSDGSAILYGVCSTAAETVNKTVSIPDVTELVTGLTIHVKFTNNNTASSPTLDVNGLGAKSLYQYGTTAFGTTNATTGWQAGSVVQLTYDGTGWLRDQAFNTNTTYTNVSLGQGYVTCTTAAATAAKVGTLSSYALTTGGIVAVAFTYDVPASATLNINSKGAKPLFYRGAAITANVIKGGDIATFIYNGTNYVLLCVDRWGN